MGLDMGSLFFLLPVGAQSNRRKKRPLMFLTESGTLERQKKKLLREMEIPLGEE